MARATQIVIAALWLLLSIGCGPSVWERSFTPEPGAIQAAPTVNVIVRHAPWARVGAALEAEHQLIADSNTHRDDWAPQQAREAELTLLGALQLPIEAERAMLLGRSHFKTTRTIDADAGELSAFAATLGADYAIWSRQTLGKAQTIHREPVSRDRWRWERIWDADHNRFIYVRRWEPETVWVPVVIERDEVRWVVLYVRRAP